MLRNQNFTRQDPKYYRAKIMRQPIRLELWKTTYIALYLHNMKKLRFLKELKRLRPKVEP